MVGHLQVRSVSGAPVCCFEQKVPNFTVSELEEHVHSALGLNREEDVSLTLDSQILSDLDSDHPWKGCSGDVAVEVQCVVQAPIQFSFECGTSLCKDTRFLIQMSRKVASGLRVGQLKGQAMKRIEQQRWTEISLLKFSGETLPDHQLLGEVLPLGQSEEVNLDLNLQRQTQRVYYYVAATPVEYPRAHPNAEGGPAPMPMDAGRPAPAPTPLAREPPALYAPQPPAPYAPQAPAFYTPEAPAFGHHPVTPAEHAERSVAATASPQELQDLLQHTLARSLQHR